MTLPHRGPRASTRSACASRWRSRCEEPTIATQCSCAGLRGGENRPHSPATCDDAAIEAALLGFPDPRRESVPVNALIAHQDTSMAVDRACRAVDAGYRTLKLKIGDESDVERVDAVRSAVGSDVAIRLDANGRWDLASARVRVQQFAPFDPEFVEEPLRKLVLRPAGVDPRYAIGFVVCWRLPDGCLSLVDLWPTF